MDGRERLESTVTLSGATVETVLKIPPPVRLNPKIAPPEGFDQGNPKQRQEDAIAKLVLQDLPVIANAQLLGQHPEVFSAVDRSQAEVEFRVALAPAPGAVAVSFAVRILPEQPFYAVGAVALGCFAAWALLLDAARRRRDANELILSLIEHGRITAPSLLRAESTARALADQAPAKVVLRRAESASSAVGKYFDALEDLASTGLVGGIERAEEASRRAHDAAEKLGRVIRGFELGIDERQPLEEVLAPLDRVLALWRRYVVGIEELR